jgi:hypothetical protein
MPYQMVVTPEAGFARFQVTGENSPEAVAG